MSDEEYLKYKLYNAFDFKGTAMNPWINDEERKDLFKNRITYEKADTIDFKIYNYMKLMKDAITMYRIDRSMWAHQQIWKK